MPRVAETTLPDEFASTMQQLSAEAEKTIAPDALGTPSGGKELAAMSDRLSALERTIAEGFEKLAAAPQQTEIADRLQRLDGQIAALRNTETVNQRLFNTLHQELKSYRDDFLRESLQKPFIRDLVILFDDLSTLATQLSGQAAANLQNSMHALMEILHRMDVSEIEAKEKVDRNFHRVVSYEPADFEEDDGRIVMRVKRGFVWRNQVLRPEEVVAKRFA
ncbi:MAG TPA: nucleotide exchange factor GrpE [Chthoniobacterales bacterium]